KNSKEKGFKSHWFSGYRAVHGAATCTALSGPVLCPSQVHSVLFTVFDKYEIGAARRPTGLPALGFASRLLYQRE
ncbi:MAG: hypothetical protein LUH09_06705, partial [Clostridiales bacterium]|nr:hypothetical protein [Clostridiales bacterium]